MAVIRDNERRMGHMLRVFTIRTVRGLRRTVLELWPFGIRDAANVLDCLELEKRGFVAVDDGKWDDGFYPPRPRNLSGVERSRTCVCRIESVEAMIVQMRKNLLDGVVDLSCYFPSVEVSTAQDVKDLELIFRDRSQDVALKRWGGVWMTIHDATKSHFSLASGKRFEKRLLSRIILSQEPDMDQSEIDELWNGIKNLQPDKCQIVVVSRGCIWSTCMPVELHQYEQVEKLVVGAHSAIVG
jgi:hypothetical protein